LEIFFIFLSIIYRLNYSIFELYHLNRRLMIRYFLFILLIFGLKSTSFSQTDTIFYETGDKYVGEMLNGQAHGYGRMIWSNGAYYEGAWKNNYQNGKGTMKWATGEIYIGDWVMGVQAGYGQMTWVNGDHYEGKFKDGLLDGKGVMKYANGLIQKGLWRKNSFVK